MQTQCPHCDTRFRVTQTQVNAADGLVRCGVCKQVFNAIEVAAQHARQAPFFTAPTEAPDEHDDHTGSPASELASVEKADNATDEAAENHEFDLFKADEASVVSVIPDDFRHSYADNVHSDHAHSIVSTLLWSLGILLLTATLALEYIWFNRNQFNQIPEIQAGLEKLCSQIECKDLNMRDPSQIELVTRNVYSHPNEKGALVINVTMKNNADFAQPYPVMQIDFSNIRGNTVAARRFLPTEYLQIDAKRIRPLQPHMSTSLSMEIQDPGKAAMTYEFNFL